MVSPILLQSLIYYKYICYILLKGEFPNGEKTHKNRGT